MGEERVHGTGKEMLTLVAAALLSITASAASPDVLIVQHSYDGPVEQAGTLVRWHYTGGHMLVEWVDTTADGIFRSGFE